MPIQVTCTNCQKVIKAPDNLAGKRVKCPQCSTVLAIPGTAPAGAATAQRPAAPAQRPAARPAGPGGASHPSTAQPRGPAPVQGGFPKQMGPPGMLPPPGRPMAPGGFGGVADLIDEEINRQVAKKIQEEDEEISRQAKEKAWNELMAPKFKSLEMQKKGMSGKVAERRIVSVGQVLARSWRVYTADLGKLLAVTWCGQLISTLPCVLLALPFLLLTAMIGGLISKVLPEVFGVIFVVVFMVIVPILLAGPLIAWMLTGTVRYVFGRIKGKDVEFTELFRGGKQTVSIWGGLMMCMLFVLMPVIPWILFIIAVIVMAVMQLDQETAVFAIKIAAFTAGGLTLLLGVLGQILLLKSSMFPWVVVDKGVPAQESLGISQGLTDGNFWKLRLLMMIVGFLNLLGVLTCGIGLIFLLPFQAVMWGVAYAEMSGIEEPIPGAAESVP